jgi:ribosome biogenesis protein Nip4
MNDLELFVKKFTNEKINYVKKGKKYFLINDEVLIVDKLFSEAISSGVILGESKDNFKPSIYLLELLSRTSRNKVFVNEKSEWLFLCGRDVLPEGILKDNSSDVIFLVQNEKDENLGFGKKVDHGKNRFIKNILDRGNFLRRERR